MKNLIIAAAAFFALSFALLFASNACAGSRKPPAGADAVVVLGCGLNGDQVSLMLRYRLDAALEYYRANPGSVLLLSGGQGHDEDVSEAEAMRAYLMSKGVPPGDILLEDASSSTEENMRFSKPVLDGFFGGEGYAAVYATSDFHILRAGHYAKAAGLDAEPLASRSVAHLLPAMYLREYLALMKYYTLEAWR